MISFVTYAHDHAPTRTASERHAKGHIHLAQIGMPVMHRNVSYNCRVICLNKRVIAIRPKLCLANDGNYREMRYFTPWFVDPSATGFGPLEDYYLPKVVQQVTGQLKVPIGIFALAALDTVLSFETCEELFTPNAVRGKPGWSLTP